MLTSQSVQQAMQRIRRRLQASRVKLEQRRSAALGHMKQTLREEAVFTKELAETLFPVKIVIDSNALAALNDLVGRPPIRVECVQEEETVAAPPQAATESEASEGPEGP